MPLFSNGQYKIFNAQFSTHDADLIFGVPTGIIGGFVNNSGSRNMVWNLKNATDNGYQITLTSATTSSEVYASVSQVTPGASLHGSANETVWTLIPTCHLGQYWILAPSTLNTTVPSGLVWSLSNDVNMTPLKLAQIDPYDRTQRWSFEGQVGTEGSMDGLD